MAFGPKSSGWNLPGNTFKMYKHLIILFTLFSMHAPASPQGSIHIEQSEYYHYLGDKSIEEYDKLSGFELLDEEVETRFSGLNKIVFGYHPYWGGSNYLNYQWDLLSDLCYFSYEVDPATGDPTSIHGWHTSPAIDSALANDVRVHLCATLFSGHATFFNNPVARETLTNNLIELVVQRGAHGVNLDFEAVPSSQGSNMLEYIAEFSNVFHDSIPEGILSIAMPAVDWSGIYDLFILDQHIDLFMIMGYDYYWNGSSQAGPVDPHYSMTSGYNYSVSRTVSWYQSEEMPLEKMLIGLPYYAREWPTASGIAPSSTTGNGDAHTWSYIRNNASGHYIPENKHTEPNSFGPYYAYNSNGWYQCFVNDDHSFARRYKMVNYRGLAGIGIWALGYDNGYTDLWDIIAENFAQGVQITLYDTLYDSGGPSWNYYNNEDYSISIHGEENESIRLEFTAFDLEIGYDSLWVYDGYYPGGELLGGFTGSSLPPVLYSSDVMSLRFESDHNTTAGGWTALVESFLISVNEKPVLNACMKAYPNPANEIMNFEFRLFDEGSGYNVRMYDMHGRLMTEVPVPGGQNKIRLDVSGFLSGIYLVVLANGQSILAQQKIVVLP
jgi:hypothetical protein